MTDLLQLSAHLPVLEVDPGHVLVHEGESSSAIWILLSGELEVLKGTAVVTRIDQPGAVIGEMAALLGTAATATVTVRTPSRLRWAAHGENFLFDPAVMSLVAVGLAERLNRITAYLADLKEQYGDAPGTAMVPEVLNQLMDRRTRTFVSGSVRDPDPEY
jgi:CRP/FNR family transcriptional regulator, cyclic AMP receptor protein